MGLWSHRLPNLSLLVRRAKNRPIMVAHVFHARPIVYRYPTALCSVNGVGPQTQSVLWNGVAGRSHIVGLWPTLRVLTTKVCCNACEQR